MNSSTLCDFDLLGDAADVVEIFVDVGSSALRDFESLGNATDVELSIFFSFSSAHFGSSATGGILSA